MQAFTFNRSQNFWPNIRISQSEIFLKTKLRPEYSICRNLQDVAALSKYFILLEEESNPKKGLRHNIPHNSGFRNQLLTLCNRSRASKQKGYNNTPVESRISTGNSLSSSVYASSESTMSASSRDSDCSSQSALSSSTSSATEDRSISQQQQNRAATGIISASQSTALSDIVMQSSGSEASSAQAARSMDSSQTRTATRTSQQIAKRDTRRKARPIVHGSEDEVDENIPQTQSENSDVPRKRLRLKFPSGGKGSDQIHNDATQATARLEDEKENVTKVLEFHRSNLHKFVTHVREAESEIQTLKDAEKNTESLFRNELCSARADLSVRKARLESVQKAIKGFEEQLKRKHAWRSCKA